MCTLILTLEPWSAVTHNVCYIHILDACICIHFIKFIYFRTRLFAEDSVSPAPEKWEVQDDEIAAVITPYSKAYSSVDSGFKSQSDVSVSYTLFFCHLE